MMSQRSRQPIPVLVAFVVILRVAIAFAPSSYHRGCVVVQTSSQYSTPPCLVRSTRCSSTSSLEPRQETSALLQHALQDLPPTYEADIRTKQKADAVLVPSKPISIIGKIITHLATTDEIRHGSLVHLSNAALGGFIPLFLFGRMVPLLSTYMKGHHHLLSQLIIEGSFVGLIIDNVVNAMGRYIGEGLLLRRLTRLRLILHGLTIPSLFVPVIELAHHAGLFSRRASMIATIFFLSYAAAEAFEWSFLYDIKELSPVDNRASREGCPRAMPGTLSYTCGKVVKCIVPAAVLQVFTLIVGYKLWCVGAAAGPWLFASGVLTMLSCGARRPDLQAFGETTMLSLMWAGVTAASSACGGC